MFLGVNFTCQFINYHFIVLKTLNDVYIHFQHIIIYVFRLHRFTIVTVFIHFPYTHQSYKKIEGIQTF